MKTDLRFTYIGGSTALIEMAGIRFLTDPTFDSAGAEFRTPIYALQRTLAPAMTSEAVLPVDVVLLSHDHHFDNLDESGRAFLPRAGQVLTTQQGAGRLGGNAVGLQPWESVKVAGPGGSQVVVTATPARHGPADGDRGPVIGFVLTVQGSEQAIYVSGDTVWYPGMQEVVRRYWIGAAILFMGAARVQAVGPHHLTLTAEEAVEAAKAMPDARIVPVHYEGWRHFSEGRREIAQAFRKAGIEDRLVWGDPGVAAAVL